MMRYRNSKAVFVSDFFEEYTRVETSINWSKTTETGGTRSKYTRRIGTGFDEHADSNARL